MPFICNNRLTSTRIYPFYLCPNKNQIKQKHINNCYNHCHLKVYTKIVLQNKSNSYEIICDVEKYNRMRQVNIKSIKIIYLEIQNDLNIEQQL